MFSRGFFLYGWVILGIWGCATLDRRGLADEIAGKARFQKALIAANPFTLTAYCRFEKPGRLLTVYIEGDGSAWLSKARLSPDPTPRHPLALELAALDPAPNVAYLGRPCQYSMDGACDPAYWAEKRFSEEVIASMNEAVSRLVEQSRASELHLVGYSGGAAVAALIAERRNDVQSLRTVAGNLDPEAVNHHHGVSPLNGSINPIDRAPKLARVPQRHFVGAGDTVVPAFVAENFVEATGARACAEITRVDGADHHAGWAEKWRGLLSLPFPCKETDSTAI